MPASARLSEPADTALNLTQAECEGGKVSPWIKNHTCAECVKEVDEKLMKKDPESNCDDAAKEFIEKECQTDDRSKKCKETFLMECFDKKRPAWTANLTCTKCVEKVDIELLQKKGYNCKEEAESFITNKCGAAGSCKDIGSHDQKTCVEAKEKGQPCEWCRTAGGGGVCAEEKTPCPK